MDPDAPRRDLAYGPLSNYLKLLAVPSRLQLLRRLQIPRTIAEIDLEPTRASRDKTPERHLTRSTVEFHVKALEDAGLLRARPRVENGRETIEYQTNFARLFVVQDELRRITLQRTAHGMRTDRWEDDDAPDTDPLDLVTGPAFIAANGPREGEAWPLAEGSSWGIGRESDSTIRLLHDPFVSRHHARIIREKDHLLVSPDPRATNPTLLNWRPLAPEERSRVEPGDILRIGRTLLVHRWVRA